MRTEAARIDVDGGFYTIAEAARLLGMGSGRRITRWLQTTPSGRSPVVIRDYPKIGREHEISFLDLCAGLSAAKKPRGLFAVVTSKSGERDPRSRRSVRRISRQSRSHEERLTCLWAAP
jgi:hypothetical protein